MMGAVRTPVTIVSAVDLHRGNLGAEDRMRSRFASIIARIVLAAAVAIAVAAGFSVHSPARAQAPAHQAFVVFAGISGPANMDVLMFFPKDVKVHRGDTVTWLINGFHNVSFVGSSETPAAPEQLFVTSEINGQQVTYFNPEVTTPTIQDGGTYTGGAAESGLPVQTPTLSLVIDAAPGTYYYHCDVHYGAPDGKDHMEGSITVVDDATTIPSPTDVTLEGAKEMGDAVNQGMGGMVAAEQQSMSMPSGGPAKVLAGSEVGMSTVNQFFPMVTVIHAGETVTWSNMGPVEIHTVAWPAVPEDQLLGPGTDANGNPIFELKPAAAPTIKDGGDWVTDTPANSGILAPGQSFTAHFPNPGVYPYVCLIHPGMNGVVVVLPAGQ
jgi:plastocyanin